MDRPTRDAIRARVEALSRPHPGLGPYCTTGAAVGECVPADLLALLDALDEAEAEVARVAGVVVAARAVLAEWDAPATAEIVHMFGAMDRLRAAVGAADKALRGGL